jgi:hypothetical protein
MYHPPRNAGCFGADLNASVLNGVLSFVNDYLCQHNSNGTYCATLNVSAEEDDDDISWAGGNTPVNCSAPSVQNMRTQLQGMGCCGGSLLKSYVDAPRSILGIEPAPAQESSERRAVLLTDPRGHTTRTQALTHHRSGPIVALTNVTVSAKHCCVLLCFCLLVCFRRRWMNQNRIALLSLASAKSESITIRRCVALANICIPTRN